MLDQIYAYLIAPIIAVACVCGILWNLIDMPVRTKRKPDYDYIRRLELELFGKVYEKGGDVKPEIIFPIYNPLPTGGHRHNFNAMLGKTCECDPVTKEPHPNAPFADPHDVSDPSDTYNICDERW